MKRICFKKIKAFNIIISISKAKLILFFFSLRGKCLSNNTKNNEIMLTCHLSDNSSNKSRITKQHNKKHDARQIFMDNTKILHHINYAKDLRMFETLSIKNKETSINKISLISETNNKCT